VRMCRYANEELFKEGEWDATRDAWRVRKIYMGITILAGMTVLDAVTAEAGSLEDLIAFCQLNGIGISDSLIPGETLQSTGNTYQPSSTVTNSQLVIAPADILPGQTLADMAIQTQGSLESLVALAVLNGLSVTSLLTPGEMLNYSLTPYAPQVVQMFAANNWTPASGSTIPGPGAPVLMSGIGYWGIEYNFVVS
jgi:hypothetical protein